MRIAIVDDLETERAQLKAPCAAAEPVRRKGGNFGI